MSSNKAMESYMYFILLLFNSVNTNSGIIWDELTTKFKKNLEFLCPKVDICDENATTTTPRLNGVTNERGFISCCLSKAYLGKTTISICENKDTDQLRSYCVFVFARWIVKIFDFPNQHYFHASHFIVRLYILVCVDLMKILNGCSCHADCHESFNCCFPTKLERIHQNKTAQLSEQKATVDGSKSNDTEQEQSMLLKECVYVVTGTPDNSWPLLVDSYRMVSTPPKQGCYYPFPLKNSARKHEQSSCNSTIVPWGKLYPVYSKERNTIYINDLCARCYGVDNFIKWTPLLVCDPYDYGSRRLIALSEQLNFTNLNFSNYCRVEFLFNDNRVLEQNRCFVKTVSECEITSSNGDNFLIPSGVNMTASEIISGCHSGLYSPVKRVFGVYSNAFCAICNDALGFVPLCLFDKDDERVKGRLGLTFLLDASFIEENYLGEVFSASPTHPKACFVGDSKLDEKKCRELFCPSGQIRRKDGTCELPSKNVYNVAFRATVELEYLTKNVSIMAMLKSNSVNSSLIHKEFQAASPWQPHWNIVKILHSVEEVGKPFKPYIAIETEIVITRLDIVMRDIKAMADTWTIHLHNVKIEFRQKFLEYTLINNGTELFIPKWKHYSIFKNLNFNLSLEFSVWITIYVYRYWNFMPRLASYIVTQLHVCEQVVLDDDEYYLLDDNILMFNKLTNRVMFDNEFELVGGDGGNLIPRVCVFDTTLTLIQKSNQAYRYGIDYTLLIVVILILHVY